jgi:quercetin dioxygenase-like cupin family protein
MPEEAHEKIVAEMAKDIDREKLETLVFDLEKYQVYSDDMATVAFAYISGQLGVVFWNLEPGQENDYHMHPTTEHLHVVVAGEVEYTLGDLDPITVKAGQAVMVPEQVPHGIRNKGIVNASYFAVTSPGDYQKVLVDRPA